MIRSSTVGRPATRHAATPEPVSRAGPLALADARLGRGRPGEQIATVGGTVRWSAGVSR